MTTHYLPTDTEYTGLPYRFMDDCGFVPNTPIDRPDFPVVYTPQRV